MELNDYGRSRGQDLLDRLQTDYDLKRRGLKGAMRDLLVDACRAAEVSSESIDLEELAWEARKIYQEMG